ncbi:MAG TPA: HAD hydrolase family protein, partial [Candidatus Saccharimonadales bacterium]|nr:HAD hydrolase family protein [Candidatus Saccharimonadales bacterium]
MGKLVLADVDGTILRYGKETTTRRVAEAVVRMQEQGHALVPVTSRSARLMGRLALQLRLRHLGVLDGGATVYDFATDSRDATLSCWLEPHKTAAIIKAIGRYCSEVYYGEDSSRFGERATI